MSSHDPDITRLLQDVERFLRQEREVYGDILPMLNAAAPSDADAPPGERTPDPQQTDLFGEAVPAAPPAAPGRHAGPVRGSYPDESWVPSTSLVELETQTKTCVKCSLGYTRKSFVFGTGNPNAGLVLIGEAPGADEDEQGEPFVGRAGQLLNKILEAIRFKREDVYICNILKCRPPNNREPQADEIDLCEPYLWKQIELIKPKLILCLGRVAGQALLKTNESLTALRSRTHQYQGVPVMVTYHPAALLRNPHWKKPVWEDVQKLRAMYDEMTR